MHACDPVCQLAFSEYETGAGRHPDVREETGRSYVFSSCSLPVRRHWPGLERLGGRVTRRLGKFDYGSQCKFRTIVCSLNKINELRPGQSPAVSATVKFSDTGATIVVPATRCRDRITLYESALSITAAAPGKASRPQEVEAIE